MTDPITLMILGSRVKATAKVGGATIKKKIEDAGDKIKDAINEQGKKALIGFVPILLVLFVLYRIFK